MIIAVTGTPGCGKTTLSKLLTKELRYEYLDVNTLIKDKNLENYDDQDQTNDVDIDILNTELTAIIKSSKNLIIDSHLSHHLPKHVVDICIVMICSDKKELERRLKERDYPPHKVADNIEAENFETCLIEAQETGHEVLIVDSAKEINTKEIIKQIQNETK